MMFNKKTIIAIEGVDFSGKTTLINNFKRNFPDFFYCRLPDGELRDLLLFGKNKSFDVKNLLFAADRSIAIEKFYESEWDIGIFDRYLLSTLIYQGNDSSDHYDKINKLHNFLKLPLPDKTIILTAKISEILHRRQKRFYENSIVDVYEKEIKSYELRKKLYEEKVLNSNKDEYLLLDTSIQTANDIFWQAVNWLSL